MRAARLVASGIQDGAAVANVGHRDVPAGDDAHRQCGSGKLATRAELGVQAEERGPKCSLDCVFARAVKLGQRAAKLQRKAFRQRSGGELGSCGAVMAVDDGV